jgi:hypothetical protein
VLCASAVAFGATSVLPGATASYAITVGSTNVDATGVTITISVNNTTAAATPTFGTCFDASGNVCTITTLAAGAPQEIVAGAAIKSTATAGTVITLTATVAAPGATSSVTASANVTVAAKPSTGTTGTGTGTGTTTGTGTGSSTTGTSANESSPLGTIPDLPSFDLPGLSIPGLPNGAFTTPSNPSGLFPTVSPNSGSQGGNRSKAKHKATLDSATLPLGARLIDGQLAGLAVLLVAVAIAVVRLSLRKRPHESGPADSAPAATPAS